MVKYISYLWRELPSDNCWRIQTTDPNIKSKLRRRGRIVGKTSSKVKAVITLYNDKDLKSFEKLI